MKKQLFIIGIILLISSCDSNGYYYNTVRNESGRTVTYTFNYRYTDELKDGESIDYQTKKEGKHTGIENVDAGSPFGFGYSVRLIRDGYDYVFIKFEPYSLNVFNSLPIEITINAGDFIDNEGTTKMTIDTGETKNAKIYTNKPNFSVETTVGYPIIVDYNFTDNEINAVIR